MNFIKLQTTKLGEGGGGGGGGEAHEFDQWLHSTFQWTRDSVDDPILCSIENIVYTYHSKWHKVSALD